MRILSGLILASLVVAPVRADWSDFKSIAPKPGPAATYGCAAVSDDEAWLCLALQCDAKGSIGAYFIVAGGADLRGSIPLSIGGQRHALGEATQTPDGRFDYRIGEATPDFLAALKTGREVVLEAPPGRLNKGYDRIPLKKAQAEIARVERACGMTAGVAAKPTPAAQTAGGEPDLYDIARKEPYKSTLKRLVAGGGRELRWIAEIGGPAGKLRDISVGGEPRQFGTVCKMHDCGDNDFRVLFRNGGAEAAGVLVTPKGPRFFGSPSPAEKKALLETEE